MSVALSKGVMLLSEIIIIYLAIAAPFGVANFLRQPAGTTHTRSLLQATYAAFLWPLALLPRSFVHKKFRRVEPDAATPEVSTEVSMEVSTQLPPSREQRADDAQRALLSSLYRIGDTAEEVSDANTVATNEAVRETGAAVERYVGLTLAVADADEAASPHTPRETELCRLSGRAGDDLDIAALCHGRRNIARLRAHQADSRLALLHALAELREVFESTFVVTTTDVQAAATRPLFAALLETYVRTMALLSLFEDEHAAARVARLLDAVRARLRRIESLNPHIATESSVQTDTTGNVFGDEPCTTSIPQTNPQTQLSRTQPIRAHG
jgi:hypothetical protein